MKSQMEVCKMKTTTTRFYYSMADIYAATNVNYLPTPFNHVSGFNVYFESVLSNNIDGFPADDEITEELFKRIWMAYYNKPIIYIDAVVYPWTYSEEIEPSVEEIQDAVEPLAGVIGKWLLDTKDRYEYLIKAYKEQEVNFLKELGSKSTTKFNDTPQNGGLFTNDGYMSNISATETTTDVATPIARLKEIKDNLKNLYEE